MIERPDPRPRYYEQLTSNTKFVIKDHLIDRRWNIEQTHFLKFPKCSRHRITYYIKTHFTKGYERRQKTRKTWGKNKSLVFIAFTKNAEEMPSDAGSSDLLLTNTFSETVDLLAVKIALGVYHASKCNSHAAFTDDDVYFFTDQFEKTIHDNWSIKKTVAVRGLVKVNEQVVRDINSPWAKYLQTKEEYPYETFPAYANGAGYIASKLAIDKIIETIPYTMLLRHLDDVYFGLLCRDAGVELEYDGMFTNGIEHITSDRKYPCGLYNLHGYNLVDEFIKVRDEQCKNNTRFRVIDWKNMIDRTNSMAKEIEALYGE